MRRVAKLDCAARFLSADYTDYADSIRVLFLVLPYF